MTTDLRALRLALIDNWKSLLLDLLGKPSRRAAGAWRWNRRGSVSVVVSGRKTGTWFDHEAGIGGGPLELIARIRGGDWRDAADWARAWLGLPRWERQQNVQPAQADADPIILTAANDAAPDPEADRRAMARRATAHSTTEAHRTAGNRSSSNSPRTASRRHSVRSAADVTPG